MFVVACSSEGYSFVVICLIYQLAVCQPALILGMFSLTGFCLDFCLGAVKWEKM